MKLNLITALTVFLARYLGLTHVLANNKLSLSLFKEKLESSSDDRAYLTSHQTHLQLAILNNNDFIEYS